MAVEDDERVSFLGRPLPAGFVARSLLIGVGGQLPFDSSEWADALVIVEVGQVELEGVDGSRARFASGAVLYLDRLPLRLLRNPGSTVAVLVGVSRVRGHATS
jgi:hypothetical protein